MHKADFLAIVRVGAGTTLGGVLVLILLAWAAQQLGWIKPSEEQGEGSFTLMNVNAGARGACNR